MSKTKLDFDGFTPSIHHIIKTCKVSKRTAQRWRSGDSDPSYSEYELLRLHHYGKIMPESWPHYFEFQPHDEIYCGNRRRTHSWQQLQYFSFITSAWQKTLQVIPLIEGEIEHLKQRLPKAELIKLEEYRAILQTEVTRDFIPDEYALNTRQTSRVMSTKAFSVPK